MIGGRGVFMEIKNLDQLLKVKYDEKMKLAVVASQDEGVLEAVVEASDLGIIEPILIGDKEKTKSIGEVMNLSIDDFQIIDEKDLAKAAEIGVKMVREKSKFHNERINRYINPFKSHIK